jgi:hypothetical protein
MPSTITASPSPRSETPPTPPASATSPPPHPPRPATLPTPGDTKHPRVHNETAPAPHRRGPRDRTPPPHFPARPPAAPKYSPGPEARPHPPPTRSPRAPLARQPRAPFLRVPRRRPESTTPPGAAPALAGSPPPVFRCLRQHSSRHPQSQPPHPPTDHSDIHATFQDCMATARNGQVVRAGRGRLRHASFSRE